MATVVACQANHIAVAPFAQTYAYSATPYYSNGYAFSNQYLAQPVVSAPFRAAPLVKEATLVRNSPLIQAVPVSRSQAVPVFQAAPLAQAGPVNRIAPIIQAAPAIQAAPVVPAAPVIQAVPIAQAAKLEEFESYPQYSYAYNVEDSLTGDSKTQEETREGDVVKGSYSLIEPDGSRRIVKYYADPVNGFNAIVEKDVPVAALIASTAASKQIVAAPLVV